MANEPPYINPGFQLPLRMPPDDDCTQRQPQRTHPAREDLEEQPSAKRRRAGSHEYPPESGTRCRLR